LSSPVNAAINITVYAKHDSTGLAESQRLHWQIIDPTEDPIRDEENVALVEWIAEDSADWQSSVLQYVRTNDKPLMLRVTALRGSGNAYAYYDAIALGVSRARIVNGV